MATRKWFERPLALTSALTAVTALSGSLATDPGSAWYRALDKPGWKPPSWVFPIVWTALYTDIALTSAKVIEDLEAQGDPASADRYRNALVLNLALNQGWSWAFFRAHRLGSATVLAGLLAASSWDLARRAGPSGSSRMAALAPYAAWCSFATFLTAEIRRRNS
ncbi:tryptophan-rich sensory protein [Tessaracoccus sp. MC1865]|uniref:TspO/MBR family protein n=1 Tax=unclassified Tessaracoccus TaxID=2635419 RepID=UPI00096F22FC|nr:MULTISPECIES: TspO/MBR family protein [unclassified Tessaracoccus]MBB1484384.1 tryptophan-rich sensory protein [Tessaracoccus sp. MC1865]MBB1509251.1 tryptophan-rich sensory protein [Tessaracoccus sp. MC1756]MCG6567178.1 tryptophan-rich sensory protein [Tessaracoccus sp. ZS01]OMG57577.1 hypothetical protein BJN44_06005 [Tessaracoccus sp. ZS01]QTO38508.1 tryptophan-rich sensory protein [Tessaracoccus sp. MC1865]